MPQPPADLAAIDSLLAIMATLRGPEGCPWDREQTARSLVPGLIEETYEVVSAIQNNDEVNLCEELGDILLQVVFQAQLASERGAFAFADVVRTLGEKLVRRHPHVYPPQTQGEGGMGNLSSAQVLVNWEEIKKIEKAGVGSAPVSALDGVPEDWPTLLRAQKIQRRAARVGFDWPDALSALDKVEEEVVEIREAIAAKASQDEIEEEIGDLLFAAVSVARLREAEAELLLRQATEKFSGRFRAIESLAVSRGREFAKLTAAEADVLWEEVKANEKAAGKPVS